MGFNSRPRGFLLTSSLLLYYPVKRHTHERTHAHTCLYVKEHLINYMTMVKLNRQRVEIDWWIALVKCRTISKKRRLCSLLARFLYPRDCVQQICVDVWIINLIPNQLIFKFFRHYLPLPNAPQTLQISNMINFIFFSIASLAVKSKKCNHWCREALL